ncbi:MAG TPA: hypothetical protein VJY39_18685 [Acidisphaera sp.]|nr:hypothetical protein [Acidisphaera sp.]
MAAAPRDVHIGLAILVVVLSLALPVACETARAVPAFAQQTGEPCTACHIGAFGPQLTPYGRAFKIGGYTQAGGQGLLASIPLAATAITSFTHTGSPQPSPAAADFGDNNNVSLDQVSLYLAGRAAPWAGGFIQGTYDDVSHTLFLDQADVRPFTTAIDLGDTTLRVGLSVNNNPTVQDPYNSTYVWGYPFVASQLAPTPAAQPAIATALSENAIGVTAYAWYDQHLYLEAGGYATPGPSLLHVVGHTLGAAPFGSTRNIAPYARVAYEWNWGEGRQSAHVGGLFLHSNFNPSTSAYSVDGSSGHNGYTDLAIDAGYQFLGNRTHIFTAEGIYTNEQQNLQGAFNAGTSSQANNNLQQVRLTLTYYYQQTYGLTFGWQDTWGTANPLLYAPAPVTGSANGKPDSNAFIIEADWVPFGKSDSVWRPLANLKLGLQGTVYTRFNGGTRNYDGFGRNASANDTLFAFAWFAF